MNQRSGKGASIKYVHRIFGALDPPPPVRIFSTVCLQNWPIFEPLLGADVHLMEAPKEMNGPPP